MALTVDPDDPTPAQDPRPRPRSASVGAVIAGVLVLVLAAVGLRLDRDLDLALRRAATAERAGDAAAAIVALGEAIRAHPPVGRGRERASEALAELAGGLEGSDPALARQAWRELRSGWFATRGPGAVDESWVERAEAGLARTGAVREASIRPDPLPDPAWSAISLVALVGWSGAAAGLIGFGLDRRGRVRVVPATRWAVGLVAALGLWALALTLA